MKIYVGSQLGNSHGVANELTDLLEYYDKNINISVHELDALIDDDKEEVVLIICSTTGNGDFPENTLNFWKIVKNRKLDKTLRIFSLHMLFLINDKSTMRRLV